MTGVSLQVLYSLLNQSENVDGWPRVVSEDIVKQVHKLKNEMFVMGGKVKGKTLLPVPEHLGSLDGTLASMERWGPCPLRLASRTPCGWGGAEAEGGGRGPGGSCASDPEAVHTVPWVPVPPTSYAHPRQKPGARGGAGEWAGSAAGAHVAP